MLRTMPGIVFVKLNINFKKELSKEDGWSVHVEWHQNT